MDTDINDQQAPYAGGVDPDPTRTELGRPDAAYSDAFHPAVTASTESRNLAMVAHLSAFAAFAGIPSFVGPLAIWLWQRDTDPFVADQAKEALNFNLSLLIYAGAAVLLTIVTFGIGLLVVVPGVVVGVVGWLVLSVLAGVRASEGHRYRYPLTLRLVS